MSPRTGRPKSENPKNIQLKIRADKELVEELNYCCEKLETNRSEIIRLGVKRVKNDIDKKE